MSYSIDEVMSDPSMIPQRLVGSVWYLRDLRERNSRLFDAEREIVVDKMIAMLGEYQAWQKEQERERNR